MTLLHIDSSALGGQSVTRSLTAAVVDAERRRRPGMSIRRRDLDAAPLPHLSAASLGGADAALAADVLDEFLAADTVVVGVPMYNFAIPSTLKAWIDRIAVAGRTFRYTADGPVGLAGGKRVILVLAAGGEHAGQPTDFVEPYLRQLFGFLGVRDLRVIRADGVALSPERRRQAIDAALRELAVDIAQAA